MKHPRPQPATMTALLVYLVLAVPMLLEQAGRTTQDTRAELTEGPAAFVAGVFSLWNGDVSFGELRNQAYGYIFPQGPWFVLGDLMGMAPWVTQRLWSIALIVAACEGSRRLSRGMGLGQWSALVAGLTYGLSIRMVAQVGVRSAEVLPTVALPWVALPVVLCLNGRMRGRDAALLSAAAFSLSGAANATATIAGLPIIVVLLVWGRLTRRSGWSLPLWWIGCMGVVSVWWVYALMVFGRYSPPFFDFVEDARVATAFTGFSASVRGASNWVNAVELGGVPWWPGGLPYVATPWLVAVTAFVAALGVVGLAVLRTDYRTPLAWSAGIGLVCLTIAHTGPLDSPLSPLVRDLLDGSLAPLRNVHKIDPVLRLPVAVGLGAAAASVASFAVTSGKRARLSGLARVPDLGAVTAVLAAVLVLAAAQPVLAGQTRTPGWTEVPGYWQQAADFIEDEPGGSQTWVLPGAGFGLQQWGWTLEEPLQLVTDQPWVARSQVPLGPGSTIRMLTSLESSIETGFGSPRLGDVLARIGITHVVVRHDLDTGVAGATSSATVSAALSRSNGVKRVAVFGAAGLGPAVEVYRVTTVEQPRVEARDVDDALTVTSAVDDVVSALGEGLVDPSRVALVQGDSGWGEPADIQGDAYRLRERNFGRVHDAYSAVLTEDADLTLNRTVADYPGPPGSSPVVAEYDGIAGVSASSTSADANGLGPTRPETDPFAALDGDPITQWQSALFSDPEEQWWQVDFLEPRRLDEVSLGSRQFDPSLVPLEVVEFVAGAERKRVRVEPDGLTVVDLGGVVADRLRIRVVKVQGNIAEDLRTVAIDEVDIDGLKPRRTLAMPEVTADRDVAILLQALPETRACRATLLGPDCDPARFRPSYESAGIERTVTVPDEGRWNVSGYVAARSKFDSMTLLQPLHGPVVLGTSVLSNDPGVSFRMAYDGEPTTSWISSPVDPRPALDVTWHFPRTISRIQVGRPASPGLAPTQAVLVSGDERRVVDLTGLGTFEPLTMKRLTITFSRDDREGRPLGMSELELSPGSAVHPFRGANPTGAFCGYGPKIVVDGEPHETRVEGLMGDVVSAGPLYLTTCDGPIQMSAGKHRISIPSTNQFQPTFVQLSRRWIYPAQPSRELQVVQTSESRVEAMVGPGDEAVLSGKWNFNDGWRAFVDGNELEPQVVDGWSQGWILPEGTSGLVVMEYAPQQPYRIGIVIGLVLAGLLLMAALGVLWRRWRHPTDPGPTVRPEPRGRPGRRVRFLVVAALLPAMWVLGGVAGLVAALVCLLLLRRRWWLAVPGSLLLAGVIGAGWSTDGISLVPEWVDLVTGAGAFLVVTRLCLHPIWPLPDTVRAS